MIKQNINPINAVYGQEKNKIQILVEGELNSTQQPTGNNKSLHSKNSLYNKIKNNLQFNF